MTAPQSKPARDITDLAREMRYAWDVACAAVPFGDDLRDHIGVIHGGDEDPRYAVLIAARLAAFERALAELVSNAEGYQVEPWMITALRNGMIPGPADGSVPGSEAVAPEGLTS
jgi:hypothetical protein